MLRWHLWKQHMQHARNALAERNKLAFATVCYLGLLLPNRPALASRRQRKVEPCLCLLFSVFAALSQVSKRCDSRDPRRRLGNKKSPFRFYLSESQYGKVPEPMRCKTIRTSPGIVVRKCGAESRMRAISSDIIGRHFATEGTFMLVATSQNFFCMSISE